MSTYDYPDWLNIYSTDSVSDYTISGVTISNWDYQVYCSVIGEYVSVNVCKYLCRKRKCPNKKMTEKKEGLLKKRIRKAVPYHTRLKETFEVLDEAAAEFEKLIAGTWCVEINDKGETVWNLNAYAKDSWLAPREAIKWFRKWFGDVEK